MIMFQMDHRTKNRVNMHESMVELQQHYDEFNQEFTIFFEELRQHCTNKVLELNA
jgi:acyl carrier protein phosphodiesterase